MRLPPERKLKMAARAATHRGNLLAFGLFLAFCVVGNLTGFAAGAPMNSAPLGTGTGAVSACQGSPIGTAFDTAYDAGIGGYAVTAVRISGLDTQGATGCGGRQLSLVLSGSGGLALAERDGAVPVSGSTLTVDVSDLHVSAASVTSVVVALGG